MPKGLDAITLSKLAERLLPFEYSITI